MVNVQKDYKKALKTQVCTSKNKKQKTKSPKKIKPKGPIFLWTQL